MRLPELAGSQILRWAGTRSQPWLSSRALRRVRRVQLSTLLSEIEPLSVAGDRRIDQVVISSIEVDADRVQAGSLFVMMPFWVADRRNNLSRALARGAVAIVAERPSLLADAPVGILVNDCRFAFGRLLSAFHQHPSRSMTVLAVTGTQGKTTVTHLLRHVLCAAGRPSESIGTLGATVNGVFRETGYTTPPAEVLQSLLAEMRSAGATHVCVEASSEGLALGRLAGTTIAVGGLTNLTRDHLDFHGDLAAYAEAKAILFREFAQRACFNIDDPQGEQFHRAFRGDRLAVSTAGRAADLVLTTRRASLRGSFVEVRYGDETRCFMLPLPGVHNVENAAVALGMALLAGLPLSDGVQALETVSVPSGRLEKVGDRPRVLVDFAHTPSALRRVLTELKSLAPGRLVCVFGAGGNRDPGKRPEMGQTVSALADVAIVTSDNPRWEDASTIIGDVLSGVSGHAEISIEPDRHAALTRAIQEARDDDTILIAGKGHEAWQEIRGAKLPLDDRAICRQQLAIRHEAAAHAGLPLSAVEAALETSGMGGRAIFGFSQVVVDSKAVVAGSLFVALAPPSSPAGRKAGNLERQIRQAAASGATGVVCEPILSSAVPRGVRSFGVPDMTAAYRSIAGAWRRSFELPVVAVAGAAGKTTTKDLIAAALSRRFNVLATQENMNGLLGVPHTLLQLRVQHDVAVVEIGIDAPGVMADQAALADPDIAVLTSLGFEHLDGLGDLASAVNEEMALFRHVAHANGALFVNLDDPLIVSACAGLEGGRRIGFTLAEDATAQASQAAVLQIVRGTRQGDHLVIEGKGLPRFALKQPLPGPHNARNIVAAVAIAHFLGAEVDGIRTGLEHCRSSPGRTQCVEIAGIQVICDFYNANPVSMTASLQLLHEMRQAGGGRAWACLGEMAEISSVCEEAHRNVAREAYRLGFEHVVTIGSATRFTVDELHRLGSRAEIRCVDSCAEMAEVVLRGVAPSDVVLLKASRSNRLELAWEHLAQALWLRDMRRGGKQHESRRVSSADGAEL